MIRFRNEMEKRMGMSMRVNRWSAVLNLGMGCFRRIGMGALIVAVLLLSSVARGIAQTDGPAARGAVYVIDVHGDIEPILADFVVSSLDDAAKAHARAVILDMDTNGGLLDSADQIQKAIYNHDNDFPIVGFVHNKAFSSGALITLSCRYIAMTSGATLGSALPHPGLDESPDKELLQAIQNRFKSLAAARRRNPDIAVAMVTAPKAIPSLGISPGDILSLTQQQAKTNGYCDIVAQNNSEILASLKINSSNTVVKDLGGWQVFTSVLLNGWVTILLIGAGMALIIAETLTMHTNGLLAILGMVLIGIVFAAHVGVGSGSFAGVLVFLGGIALFLVEIHLFPGHGIASVLGLICLFGGMFFALGGNHSNALFSTVGSLIVTIGALAAFFIYLPRSPVWRKLAQNSQQSHDAGYVSSADFSGYLGKHGMAITTLRPSGVAEVDGVRLSVVTKGDFVSPGAQLEVVNVNGGRIVVEALHSNSEPASQ
jgi:membrane-bound serine protease (ClpP class)